jgi:hypothetical protein
MASQDVSETYRPPAVDRSHSGARGGNIGMVLLVAVALVGAAVGLLLIGRGNAGPYILALLALLARWPPACSASPARTAPTRCCRRWSTRRPTGCW